MSDKPDIFSDPEVYAHFQKLTRYHLAGALEAHLPGSDIKHVHLYSTHNLMKNGVAVVTVWHEETPILATYTWLSKDGALSMRFLTLVPTDGTPPLETI